MSSDDQIKAVKALTDQVKKEFGNHVKDIRVVEKFPESGVSTPTLVIRFGQTGDGGYVQLNRLIKTLEAKGINTQNVQVIKEPSKKTTTLDTLLKKHKAEREALEKKLNDLDRSEGASASRRSAKGKENTPEQQQAAKEYEQQIEALINERLELLKKQKAERQAGEVPKPKKAAPLRSADNDDMILQARASAEAEGIVDDFIINGTEQELKSLTLKSGVVRVLATPDGNTIAFNGNKYTHFEAATELGLNYKDLGRGFFEPKNMDGAGNYNPGKPLDSVRTFRAAVAEESYKLRGDGKNAASLEKQQAIQREISDLKRDLDDTKRRLEDPDRS
jgi:hypothetical protein